MKLLDRLNGPLPALVTVVLLLLAGVYVFTGGGDEKTLTAHFSRAVAVYEGSEVRLMGVRIGSVDAVVPEGESVRVEMSYDADYKLPADASALIVTPTLVADRFVQVAPAYTGGAVLADGADIPLAKTGSPIELDRIYRSLAELSDALGPDATNSKGALSELISASAKALRGNGDLANRTLHDLADAAEVFGDNRGELFASVSHLAELTSTLAASDEVVDRFMGDLADVSGQLAGEREELQAVLAALARAVGTVKDFVHDNKDLVVDNVENLTEVLDSLVRQKDALGTALQIAPVGLGNLAMAYDVKTGSIGARVQIGPTVQSIGNVLCDVVVNSGKFGDGTGPLSTQGVCDLLRAITAPLAQRGMDIGAGIQLPGVGGGAPVEQASVPPNTDLAGMLGGER